MPPPGHPSHPGMQAAWGPRGGPNEVALWLERSESRRDAQRRQAAVDASARPGLEELVAAFLRNPSRPTQVHRFSVAEPSRWVHGESRRPRWWSRKALRRHPHGQYVGDGFQPASRPSYQFPRQVFEMQGWRITPCTATDDDGVVSNLLLSPEGVFLRISVDRDLVMSGQHEKIPWLFSTEVTVGAVCDRIHGFSAACLAEYFRSASASE